MGPAGRRSAASDTHEVRGGRGQRGAGGGRGRARLPGKGAWTGARPQGPGGGARGTPGPTQSARALWPRCPAGRGLRGTPGTKPPRPRQAGARVCGAGVGGRAGAGSLCLFISNLIRTASGELLCLTGGRAPIMQTALLLAAPHRGILLFPELRPCTVCGLRPLPPPRRETRLGWGRVGPGGAAPRGPGPAAWWSRRPAPRPLL